MIRSQIERGPLAGIRLAGCVADHAAGRGYSALKPGNAFHNLDALLVFKGNILLARDGHAIDLQTGCEINRESADLEVAVVADGRIVFADGCVVFDDVGKETRDI